MHKLATNLVGGNKWRKLHGREYITAPFTSIVPGVLPGSKGPLYYPPDEIARSVDAWNAIPILLNHPTDQDGNPISGRDPNVWDGSLLGHVFNSTIGPNGELRGEAWFDVKAVSLVRPSLLSDLQANNKIELSTGLGTVDQPVPSGTTHNGTPYTHIARNYKPDHLAILPDGKGACSIGDGCGVNNSDVSDSLDSLVTVTLVDNFIRKMPNGKYRVMSHSGKNLGEYDTEEEARKRLRQVEYFKHKDAANSTSNASGSKLSHEDLRQQLMMLLHEKYMPPKGGAMQGMDMMPDCMIMDVYDKEVVYMHDEKMWSIGYTTDQRSGKVSLSDSPPTEVMRVVSYKRVTGNGGEPSYNSQGDNMPLTQEQRKVIVDDLVTNCDCWKHNGDREVLSGFSDEKLTSLKDGADKHRADEAVANAARGGFKHGDKVYQFDLTTNQFVANAMTPAQCSAAMKECKDMSTMSSNSATPPPTPPAQPPAPVAKIVTAQDWLNSAPPEIRSVVQNAMAAEQREKQELVGRLTVNIADVNHKQAMTNWLLTKPVDELRTMASLMPVQPTGPVYNWSGAGGGPPTISVLTANDQADVLDIATARQSYDPLILNGRK